MTMQFKRAAKQLIKLRMAITGPAGAGKTYTALTLAAALGGRIALIDTEHGSADRYAGQFAFDTLQLSYFSPANYIQAIRLAEQAAYTCVIIDSLSHAWSAEGGVLDIAGGKFGNWKDARPAHNNLIQAILASKLHVIATMRSKMDYQVDQDASTKKQIVRKVGMAPVQSDDASYEFDIVGDLDWSHTMTISKTRCPALDGRSIRNPGAELMQIITAWLTDVPPFDPEPARALIRALPHYRADDEAMIASTIDQEMLRILYREVLTRPPVSAAPACDHMAAVGTDTACPSCGELLS